MTLPTDPIAECRARAKAAREKAESASDERVRTALLREAEIWDRMADHEENRAPR